MSGTGSLIPVTDEQAKAVQELAKAAQEAIKALRGVGGFLKRVMGTVPEDLISYLGGDWLKVRRAENLARILEKAQERMRARGAEPEQPAPLSLSLPLLIAAAEESRDELQDIWARLLAAAADGVRQKSFRLKYIETAKKMDPLDAAVLQCAAEKVGGNIDGHAQNVVAELLHVTRDEVDVSVANLIQLELAAAVVFSTPTQIPPAVVTAFGREFLRAVRD